MSAIFVRCTAAYLTHQCRLVTHETGAHRAMDDDGANYTWSSDGRIVITERSTLVSIEVGTKVE